MASRISRSVSSTVSPRAMQPGEVGGPGAVVADGGAADEDDVGVGGAHWSPPFSKPVAAGLVDHRVRHVRGRPRVDQLAGGRVDRVDGVDATGEPDRAGARSAARVACPARGVGRGRARSGLTS